MNRTKVSAIIASVVLVMALLVLAAHNSATDAKPANRTARLARLQNLMNEGRTEYRASFFSKKSKLRLEQVAGLDDSADTVSGTTTEVKKADAKKADPKKDAKKKDDKKKNKKKKKIKNKKDAQPGSPAEESEEETTDEETNETAMMGGLNSQVTPGNSAVSNDPQTAEQWYAYLLAHPDFEHVSKFIQMAQIDAIDSDVFYAVIEKLLLNTDVRMQDFAVLALGSTPSQESFVLLAQVSNDIQMTANTKATAKSHMVKYTRIEYVGHLGSVASLDEDASTTLAALDLVQDSARKLLKTDPTPRSPASNVTRTFDSILEAMTQLSTTATDLSVRSQAAQTVSTLRNLLNVTT